MWNVIKRQELLNKNKLLVGLVQNLTMAINSCFRDGGKAPTIGSYIITFLWVIPSPHQWETDKKINQYFLVSAQAMSLVHIPCNTTLAQTRCGTNMWHKFFPQICVHITSNYQSLEIMWTSVILDVLHRIKERLKIQVSCHSVTCYVTFGKSLQSAQFSNVRSDFKGSTWHA